MFSEVIKLIPSLDRATLGRMFSQLNQRFASLAKKFSDGMKNAFKFGGVVGIVGGLVSRLVNPLEKAEAIIDRITSKGDDAVTNAEEFQSDPGKLLRLEALAQTKGLDSATLRTLLGKFQGKLAAEQDAAAAPQRLRDELAKTTDPKQKVALTRQLKVAEETAAQGGLLHEFIGETDVTDAFFKFIQSVQQLPKAQQTVVQSDVFGEKIRGKASEFFNATDFSSILAKLPSTQSLGDAARKSGAVADEKDLLTAIREAEDFVTKSKLVDESQVQAIDQSERFKLRGEDETLQRFDALKNTSIAVQELTSKFDRFATDFINNVAPQIVTGVNTLSKLASEFLPSFQEAKTFVVETGTKGLEYAAIASVAVADFWSNGQQVVDASLEKVSSGITAVQEIWGEFKSSRIFRTFSGGK